MAILLDIFTLLVNQYFLLMVFLPLFSTIKAKSEIYLKIKGQGEKNIINNTFYLSPSKVYINGIFNETCNKSCYLDNNIYGYNNNITIVFETQVDSCKNMFNGLNDILEIDLSNFDTSKVTNMDAMFNGCTGLKKYNY